ncbi:MAG: glutaredoxin [Verrucomicrobiota bacterium]
MSTEEKLNIVCYLKTHCGWSEGVRAIMRKYELEFEEKDIIQNPALRWEMEQRSGQPLSPCVEVNGTMLADVSGEEVEAWMIENGLLERSEGVPDAPIDSSCTDEQHAAMERAALEGGSQQGNIRIID